LTDRIIPRYDDYKLIGRTRLDAVLALANSNSLLIARRLIDGVSHVNKFGENADIAKDTREDIWDEGGDYIFPTTADITHISQETDEVGTDGGATIELQGLDANWDLVVQTADLDGSDTTTEVALTTPLIRVFRMKVLAGIVLAADIHAVASGGATIYAMILAGNNQTLMAIWACPRGKSAYVTKYYASMTLGTGKEPKGANVRLWVADRDSGYEFQLKHSMGIQKGAGNIEHVFDPPMKVSQKSDIKMNAFAFDNPAQISAGFDLILIDD